MEKTSYSIDPDVALEGRRAAGDISWNGTVSPSFSCDGFANDSSYLSACTIFASNVLLPTIVANWKSNAKMLLYVLVSSRNELT